MSDKVHGGTPQSKQSLCLSCRWGLVIRGVNFQEIVACQLPRPTLLIKFPVVECSNYDDKRVPSKWDMEQIAWQVHSRNRGPVGFLGDEETRIVIEPPGEPNKPV